jgi:hypothetical protein
METRFYLFGQPFAPHVHLEASIYLHGSHVHALPTLSASETRLLDNCLFTALLTVRTALYLLPSSAMYVHVGIRASICIIQPPIWLDVRRFSPPG